MCERTSAALATALDIERAVFPGDHIGFVDDPGRFATRLHAILDQRPTTGGP